MYSEAQQGIEYDEKTRLVRFVKVRSGLRCQHIR